MSIYSNRYPEEFDADPTPEEIENDPSYITFCRDMESQVTADFQSGVMLSAMMQMFGAIDAALGQPKIPLATLGHGEDCDRDCTWTVCANCDAETRTCKGAVCDHPAGREFFCQPCRGYNP